MAKTPMRMPSAVPSDSELDARLEALYKKDLAGLKQYGISKKVALGVLRAQEAGTASDILDEGMMSVLPVATSRGEFSRGGMFTESISIFNDDIDTLEDLGYDYDVTAGTYYDPKNVAKRGGKNRPAAPAPITIRPTSTTDPGRPRTVAAGYDENRKVLTVVFRDGTFYNYYDVNKAEWSRFKSQFSKGPMLNRRSKSKPDGFLISKRRGEADLTFMDEQAQETLYRVARTNQLLYEGSQTLRPIKANQVKKTTAKKAPAGKNPSKGGKNPATKKRK
jgi:hypothetical protein